MHQSGTGLALVDGDRLVGQSPFILQLKAQLARLAPTNTNVLVTGETGTGKELVASVLHKNSSRRGQPFICINCAAIPDDLFESEIFGYERGAFTGAHAMKEGKLKLADGGTVFLDEVGDMSLHAQAKILRAIECRQVERLGSRSSVHLDVRVVSATNQNLEQLVWEGRFRKDLYFRLNVARIHLTPLRERQDDIPLLLERFMREFDRDFGFDDLVLEPEVRDFILNYAWPGNIRELRNFVEALYAGSPAKRVSCAELPEPFRTHACNGGGPHRSEERNRLLSALSLTNWNKTKAARELHCSRMTLYRKIAKYGIQRAKTHRTVTLL